MILSVIATTSPKTSLKDRLSLKLIVLFCCSFFIAFLTLWIFDVFASALEYRVAVTNLPPQPTFAAIDPNLEKELTKVMEFDSIPDAVEISDPFSDKMNLSSIKVTQSAATSLQQASIIPVSTGGGGRELTIVPSLKSSGAKDAQQRNNGTGNTPNSSTAPGTTTRMTEDTLTRIIRRNDRARMGLNVGLESTVFAIEDLLPVGVVSGGGKKEEIMFFSQSLQRTLSFTVGTKFFDGWLVAFKPEGILFTSDDENQTVRLIPWERSINSKQTRSSSLFSPSRTLVTGSND